jgi:hypothetical protein
MKREFTRNRSLEEKKKSDDSFHKPNRFQNTQKDSPSKTCKLMERKKEELRKKAIDAMIIAEQRRVRLEESQSAKDDEKEPEAEKKIEMKEAAKLEQEMIEQARKSQEMIVDDKEKKRIENLRAMKQQRIMEHLAEQEKRKKLEAQKIQNFARDEPEPAVAGKWQAGHPFIPLRSRALIRYEIEELKMMNPYRGTNFNKKLYFL